MSIADLDDVRARRLEAVGSLTRAKTPTAEIAALLGVSERTVTRCRVELGIARPTPPRLTQEQLDTAERLLAEGASYVEAAQTVGCTPKPLRRRFPGRGWTFAECGRWARWLAKQDGRQRAIA
ncbi:helix-turn-helix transcriptional regulator [Gordonia sp. OPL2]|uniref:helix-turn-helix transcriptional regulator n=1 Tax=Gordonia sp. OPL2 TaxID=2486274 RepID=UPI0016552D35|nr:helix-turn-helix transcriptional regulator [Gordonia sp. OPL2]